MALAVAFRHSPFAPMAAISRATVAPIQDRLARYARSAWARRNPDLCSLVGKWLADADWENVEERTAKAE